MKINLYLIFFFMIYSSAFGQVENESYLNKYIQSEIQRLNLISFDSVDHKQAYRIWNSYQVVELIKLSESTYSGQLVNYVTKINRNEKRIRTISQRLIIPDHNVKELIEKSSFENIEKLPDSKDINGYVTGVDGTGVVSEISSNKEKRICSYWEPESDYQNPELKEVKNVINILNAINSKIDLKRLVSSFRDNLDPGTYEYNGIILTISRN